MTDREHAQILQQFRSDYTDAVRRHLRSRSEESLAIGHDLGRRALAEGISLLDIIENHLHAVSDDPDGPDITVGERDEAALQFLLQALTALDVATRGFLDSARGYARQRARADGFAERDAFRQALVDALQDGFVVIDAQGTVTEVNTAFGEITGYGAEGLPYRYPWPWIPSSEPLFSQLTARLTEYLTGEGERFTLPIRHRNGRRVWLAIATSAVHARGEHEHIFVGTVRDVTDERAAAQREQASARLATALSAATTVSEVFEAGLAAAKAATRAMRAHAAVWTDNGVNPTVYIDGAVAAPDDRQLEVLERVRQRPAATVEPVYAVAANSVLGLTASLGDEGALWLEYSRPQPLSIADSTLVTVLAGQLSLALQRARNYEQIRNTSLTLQRAMLGVTELPPRFAVRYEPAEPPLEIGGDWYDVVPLDGDRIGVIVGDCVGRGLSAAAVMGRLRSSAQALLLAGAEPSRMLDQLDVVAGKIPDAACTTVFAAVIDVDSGLLHYSSAGHLPGLLAAPDREAQWLHEAARSFPLATFECAPRPQATCSLPPGSTLVLFTDGLVERRGVSIDDGIEQVAAALSQAHCSTSEAVAERILATRRPESGYDDDVAMVVYRQPPAPLRVEAPADTSALATIRRSLRTWLACAGIDGQLATDAVLVADEACTNSIEHGHRDGTHGHVVLEAAMGPTELVITIADTGTWKPASEDPGYRGRGVGMMRAMVDTLDIDHTDDGTRVHMRIALPRQHPESRI